MRWLMRLRVLAWALFALIGLYALVGFLVLPYLIKTYAVPAAAERLKHPIVLRDAALNPFMFSLRLNGLEVREQDQTPLLGFEELFINLHARTLLLRTISFDEIRLLMPFVSAKVNRAGKLNLLALVPASDEASIKTPDEPAPPPKERMGLVIDDLQIDQGIVEYRDESKPTPLSIDIVPIRISLRNFSTVEGSENAYAFKAEIGKGEEVAWEGSLSLEPVESDGKWSLTGIQVQTLYQAVQDRFQFDVRRGRLDLSGSYHMDLRGQSPNVSVKDGVLSIHDLTIGERGLGEPVIEIPTFSVEGIGFDLPKKTVTIARVRSADARFASWLEPEGFLNYQRLLSGSSETPAAKGDADKATGSDKPWSVTVGEIALRNYGVVFEDRSLARPVRLEVEGLDFTTTGLRMPFTSRLPLDLSLKLNRSGSISVHGQVAIEPLAADVDVTMKQIEIRPFQPYFDRFVAADIRDGALDLNGSVHYAKDHAKGPLLRVQGSLGIQRLSVTDRNEFEDVVTWKSLAVNRIALDVEPTKVHIAEIVWQEPAAQMVIEQDGRLNLSKFLVESTSVPAPADQTAPKQKSAKRSQPVTMAIDSVRLINAAVMFRDRSIAPEVRSGIADLSGTIKGLSSRELAKADVALTGKVGGTGPIKISGQINPLTDNAYTDLTVLFENVDLTHASAYAGKFAGYPITNGKLFLDLKYKIAEKALTGENKVLIDQLTFGDKTDSPDATSLPVPLAVALLKDRKGQIDIDLPVRGDLNDPDFKYGRVVLNALLNLLAKAATSPLSLLGGLIGGSGDELKFIEFAPGRTDVSDAEDKKVVTLAKVLDERPGLFLEIEGVADPQRDRQVLAEETFTRRLRAMKRGSEGPSPDRTGEEPPLSAEEEAAFINEWYAGAFPTPPQTTALVSAQPPALAEKRARLVETVRVEDAEIRQLGQERATHIRARLVEKGSVPEERVVLREVQLKEESGPMVNTRLTISGR